MKNISYVRTELLEAKKPPQAVKGIIHWARSKLFSSIGSSILSLIFIGALIQIFVMLMQWGVQATLEATSITECREIFAKISNEYSGACWGVIRERWPQLLFGFYPRELYWRPIMVLALMFAGIAPILYSKAPRYLLLVTFLFPFLGAWLLWGGSVWPIVNALMGFVFGALIYKFLSDKVGSLISIIIMVLAVLIWWVWLAAPAADILSDMTPYLTIEEVGSRQFGGFMLSVSIGVVAIFASLPLGIVLALGRQSNLAIIKAICVGFIEFIRGVPLITLLIVASTLLNIFLPPGTNFDIILRVMIMMTFFASAYIAEIIRGGLAALPKGQYEAADALGLNYWKAQRFIIMPQALKISIPGIVSTFISVFKDTTLVSIISLLDPLGLIDSIRANQDWNGIVWELYIFVAMLFFVVCFSMSRYSTYLERKLQTGHK